MAKIPKFYGVCYEEGSIKEDKSLQLGIIVSYIKGVSLTNYLKDNKITPIEKAKILIDICSIVDNLHKSGIISRGITPSGILIGNNGIYLTDFKYATDKHNNSDYVDMETIRYNAPEVFIQKGRTSNLDPIYEISTKADIWSIGTIMLEMFSELLPFSGDGQFNSTTLLLSFVHQKKINLPDNVLKTYPEIIPIIENCLEYKPEKRMSISELILKLITLF